MALPDVNGTNLALGQVVLVNGKDMQGNNTGGQINGVITAINGNAVTVQIPTERGFKGDAPSETINYATAASWTVQPTLNSGPGGV